MGAKFKVGDIVRIISNGVQPQYVGSIGRISKVYPAYSEKIEEGFVFRVNVGGKLLKGVACENDLVLTNKANSNEN